MGISKNRGFPPKSSIFNRIFALFSPSIFRYPYSNHWGVERRRDEGKLGEQQIKRYVHDPVLRNARWISKEWGVNFISTGKKQGTTWNT